MSARQRGKKAESRWVPPQGGKRGGGWGSGGRNGGWGSGGGGGSKNGGWGDGGGSSRRPSGNGWGGSAAGGNGANGWNRPNFGATGQSRFKRKIDTSRLWRGRGGDDAEFGGIQVWAPLDPYTQDERNAFRMAMKNPYVYRANWLLTKLVCGQGYTTDVDMRDDEEADDEGKKKKEWMDTPIWVPYLNKKMTPDQIRKFVDRKSKAMDLDTNIFNAYITAREQGRCVLALTPIDQPGDVSGASYHDDAGTGNYELPTSIRLIRPEYTLRPYLHPDTNELIGVQIVGLRSTRHFILPDERMVYIEKGFNQELFSDHYGDSLVDRITNVANVLNLIFTDDFLHAAESTWHQPKVFGVPIQPQDFGREREVLDEFVSNNTASKGQDIAVAQDPDGQGGVTVISSNTNSGDIGGLETIVVRCIKTILAHYNIPPFMLSEGDRGTLGGNSNEQEIDMFVHSEIEPEQRSLEQAINRQYYDKFLKVLFMTQDEEDVPLKINHRFNRAKITSIYRPDLYELGSGMVQNGMMDKSKLPEFLGIEEFTKNEDTETLGGDTSPARNTWWRGHRADNAALAWGGPNRWTVRPGVRPPYNTWDDWAGWGAAGTGYGNIPPANPVAGGTAGEWSQAPSWVPVQPPYPPGDIGMLSPHEQMMIRQMEWDSLQARRAAGWSPPSPASAGPGGGGPGGAPLYGAPGWGTGTTGSDYDGDGGGSSETPIGTPIPPGVARGDPAASGRQDGEGDSPPRTVRPPPSGAVQGSGSGGDNGKKGVRRRLRRALSPGRRKG